MMGPGWYWAVVAIRVAASLALEAGAMHVVRFAQRRRSSR
jgi:hypothetical protein